MVLVCAPAGAATQEPVKIYAHSAVILDPRDGSFLYQKDPNLRRPPASLAKMVTALVVADKLKPDDTVQISHAAATADADQIRWPEDAVFSVDQVMHGMLMTSSNGAAIALAERVAGSSAAFRALANARAKAAGATDTNLISPAGLDEDGQYSTAHDLALVARAVLANPWLRSIVATLQYVVPWPDGKTVLVHSIDKFLNRYPGAIGVKNGYTTQAQNCLAAAAVHHGVTLIAVALGSPSAYDDAARLMDIGFSLAHPRSSAADEAPPAPVVTEVAAPSEEPAVEATASSDPVATTTQTAAPVHHSHAMMWFLFFLACAYGWRVVQIKRRRAARRRQRRLRARRALEAAHYRDPAQVGSFVPPAEWPEGSPAEIRRRQVRR
ncbi:MAG: D-alanyl-D-alanine carboxypeptidase family protein [Actinomycetota bacterium]